MEPAIQEHQTWQPRWLQTILCSFKPTFLQTLNFKQLLEVVFCQSFSIQLFRTAAPTAQGYQPNFLIQTWLTDLINIKFNIFFLIVHKFSFKKKPKTACFAGCALTHSNTTPKTASTPLSLLQLPGEHPVCSYNLPQTTSVSLLLFTI